MNEFLAALDRLAAFGPANITTPMDANRMRELLPIKRDCLAIARQMEEAGAQYVVQAVQKLCSVAGRPGDSAEVWRWEDEIGNAREFAAYRG